MYAIDEVSGTRVPTPPMLTRVAEVVAVVAAVEVVPALVIHSYYRTIDSNRPGDRHWLSRAARWHRGIQGLIGLIQNA